LENRTNKVHKNLNKLDKSQWLPLEEIEIIQWDKLKKLLNYSYSSVPYYRRLFERENIKPSDLGSLLELWKIPSLSKKDIRGNFEDMLAPAADKKSFIKRTTSGSTGEPITIYRDQQANNIHTAAGWRFRGWAGHEIGDRYGRIWGQTLQNKDLSNLSFKSTIRQQLSNLIEPIEKLSAWETITKSAMEGFFQRIKSKKIRLLIGYANSVFFFAQFVNEHHKNEIKLRSVRTIAERIDSKQRNLIEDVFDCRVFDTYGNRENGLIAAECDRHEGYHINAENLYVEILDNAGHPVPKGQIGEMAITDLNNYAMPLVRYLTGDQGSLSMRSCSCGRGLPLIDKIVGRIVDMLVSSDGSFIQPFIFNGLRDFAADVERYRVVQNVKGEADLYLKVSSSFNMDQLEKIKKSLDEVLDNRLSIKCHIVDELPFSTAGKYRLVISNIQR